MFLKYSVYILTPKNHQTVMTTTKNLYTFTNRNIKSVQLPCEGIFEYNQCHGVEKYSAETLGL